MIGPWPGFFSPRDHWVAPHPSPVRSHSELIPTKTGALHTTQDMGSLETVQHQSMLQEQQSAGPSAIQRSISLIKDRAGVAMINTQDNKSLPIVNSYIGFEDVGTIALLIMWNLNSPFKSKMKR